VQEMRETKLSLDEAPAYLAEAHGEGEDDEGVGKKHIRAAIASGELKAEKQ
jgi:hypothetical protein